MNKIIEVDNKKVEIKKDVSNLYEGRIVCKETSINAKPEKSKVTIIILNYNRLEKTKRCVESVLTYTQEVDYELILIDNGSNPEMMEYLESIDFPKKIIIHIKQNVGVAFPFENISINMLNEYVVSLGDDNIVTENWLSNMMKIFESDEKIGMVNPLSSNVSNLQNPNLVYNSYEEMQEKAAKFNVSDSKKWQERLRIITLGVVYRKECLYAIGWPMTDVGFVHDFIDDDIAFRVRRMGYKVVLAGDTWICHDHKIEEKDPLALQKSIEQGRKDFQQKYHGIDAWDDVNNYIFHKLGNSIKKVDVDKPKILGIDVKCGTPILDIKNTIRKYGIFDAELSAFTLDEKYVEDLKTICDGIVACDHEEFITRKLLYDYYDYIIIDRPINAYHEPMSVLMDAFMLLKQGGQLVFSLKNMNNILSFLGVLGLTVEVQDEYCYNYSIDALARDLTELNIQYKILGNEPLTNFNENLVAKAQTILEANCDAKALEGLKIRLMADKYWISIEK